MSTGETDNDDGRAAVQATPMNTAINAGTGLARAAADARTVEADSPPDYTLAIGLFIDFIAQAVAYFRS
jgi:hypothetical protein